MKYPDLPLITPSKLINPFPTSVKTKKFKPLQSYLEFSKILPKTSNSLLHETDKNDSIIIKNIDPCEFPFLINTAPKPKNRRLFSNSCEIRSAIKSNPSSAKRNFEIPKIYYKTFEPFHLPGVKAEPRQRLSSQKPKLLSLGSSQEEARAFQGQVVVSSPKRVEITEYSRELRDKIRKVKEIVKSTENEFLEACI